MEVTHGYGRKGQENQHDSDIYGKNKVSRVLIAW